MLFSRARCTDSAEMPDLISLAPFGSGVIVRIRLEMTPARIFSAEGCCAESWKFALLVEESTKRWRSPPSGATRPCELQQCR
jgi:hypothetical protein